MGRQSIKKRERRIKEGRESTLPVDLPWTPMLPTVGRDGSHTMTDGTDRYTIYKNSRYTVLKREFLVYPDAPLMIHLSIRRNDRKPVTSWRDLQKIKNELVNPECEGVQIFPAESRLVDNANQTHIFVCSDPNSRLPFGYGDRLVSEGNHGGSVQEPFEEHVKPPDLADPEKIASAMEEYRQRHQPISVSKILDTGL